MTSTSTRGIATYASICLAAAGCIGGDAGRTGDAESWELVTWIDEDLRGPGARLVTEAGAQEPRAALPDLVASVEALDREGADTRSLWVDVEVDGETIAAVAIGGGAPEWEAVAGMLDAFASAYDAGSNPAVAGMFRACPKELECRYDCVDCSVFPCRCSCGGIPGC